MSCSKKDSVNALQRGFFDQATNKDAKCEYFSWSLESKVSDEVTLRLVYSVSGWYWK